MTDKEIHKICKKYSIENYTIEDGLVNVKGSVYLKNKGLKKIPLKFGKVKGSFDCSMNELNSLEGAPLEVGKSFFCAGNELTNLIHSPKKVGSGFWCSSNNLISLKGSPSEIGESFDCSLNNLNSLEYAPLNIGGDFYCYSNRKELGYDKHLLKMDRLRKIKTLNDKH